MALLQKSLMLSQLSPGKWADSDHNSDKGAKGKKQRKRVDIKTNKQTKNDGT